MSIKISYAITACNEHRELDKLLTHMAANLPDDGWEIVIQCDENNTTPAVWNLVQEYSQVSSLNCKVITFPLNKDFAAFKNNLKNACIGEYIFQIDADEIPSTYMLETLPELLDSNPSVDLFWVPRINHVDGLTREHVQTWAWSVDWAGRVNFPDYQSRIFKNVHYIKWVRPVHEYIEGYQLEAKLPTDDEWCLMHEKTIARQEQQNAFYGNF